MAVLPERRSAITAELVGRGFPTVLHAASHGEVVRLARAHGPGELAVFEAGLCTRADPGRPSDVAALVRGLRGAGWRHVVVLSDDVRLTRIAEALGGAQAFLVGTVPAQGADVQGGRARQAPDVEERRRHVTDRTGKERVLSMREVEVLELAASGLGNSEIAAELDLSTLTVKSHLARITRRLGARDRAHLVLLALRAGVIV